MASAVTMHPYTLVFSDDALEQRIRSERCATANKCLVLFATCMLIFSLFTPHGYTFEQTAFCILALLAICLSSGHGHATFSRTWVFAWASNICVWVGLLYSGRIKRLGPDDGHAVSACCAVYVQCSLYQRVLHFHPWHRACVFGLTLPIIVRSPHWMYSLLGALCGGEAMGYVLEHMLRDSFLHTAEMQAELSEAHAHSVNLETARREQLIAERRTAIVSTTRASTGPGVVTRRSSRGGANAYGYRRGLESIADDVSEYSWGDNQVEEPTATPGS